MNTIEIHSVFKEYRNHVCALKNINFCVPHGVFGLLGHNGAGKTTLMKLISTILKPTSGYISVLGYDTQKEGHDIRRNIGYLPQELAMYPTLTVKEFVQYIAKLKGVADKNLVLSALAQVGMETFSDRKIGKLSGGMKRRVGIAQAIVDSPQLLIVDEPTAGLDPEERVRFRSILSRYAKGGRTVLLSTHIVEDISQLCEHIAVLNKGELFFTGQSEAMKKKVSGKIKLVECADDNELEQLGKQVTILSTVYEQGRIKVRVADVNGRLSEPTVAETLEDAYVYYMGGKSHV
jgi:ABC-2 type transport system ATP-binding protein